VEGSSDLKSSSGILVVYRLLAPGSSILAIVQRPGHDGGRAPNWLVIRTFDCSIFTRIGALVLVPSQEENCLKGRLLPWYS